MIHSDVAGLLPVPPVEEVHTAEYAKNGDPILSPSQVGTFEMCPRKWAAKYIHHQPDPPAKGTLDGKRMHSLLERYYKQKVVPSNDTPMGVWALALIAKTGLPLPGPGVEAEHRFKFEHDGVWWRGSKDLRYNRQENRIIRDHKSTSSLVWAKSAEELQTDPQSIIYAWDEYINQDLVVVNEWGYVTREKYPKTLLVPTEMPFEVVAQGMEKHTATGKRILQLYREKPGVNDLPATGTTNGGCEAFGGCKVQGCDASAIDRLRGLRIHQQLKEGNTTNMANYIEELKAKKAREAAGLGAAPAPAPVAPAAPVAAAPAPTVRERLAAVPDPAPVGAAITPPAFDPPPASDAPAPARRGRGRARAPVPTVVDAALSPSQVMEVQAEIEALKIAGKSAEVRFTPRPGDEERNNGRPYVPQLAASDGYTLCINCYPHGVDGATIVLFSQYVAAVHAGIKEVKGIDLYNLAGFDGTALYQDYLRQYLEGAPPTGYLVVDSRTNEGRDALSVLERNAALVIRGF